MRYAFIQDNQHIWPVRRLCSTLDIHHSGYYAWLNQPISKSARKRQQLSGLIKQFWLESGGVYGYRKIHCDLKDVGESCGINRVHRLMKANGLKSQHGYRKPRAYAGTPVVIAANKLDRQFNPTHPNQLWVTDITYIRTHEGWLYLAVVIDLFSRLVVGWSMKSRITTDLVLDALLMALWRRSPKNKVLIHSDQGRSSGCDKFYSKMPQFVYTDLSTIIIRIEYLCLFLLQLFKKHSTIFNLPSTNLIFLLQLFYL